MTDVSEFKKSIPKGSCGYMTASEERMGKAGAGT